MKTTYFKRFTRLFVVMLLAMLPAMSWAQTYISEVVVSCRENVNAAITELESNGYTTIRYDYNHNVPSCTMPGVIIGYKTTSDRTKAITDLMIMEGEKYKCDDKSKQQIIGNKVYRPIKAFGDTYGDFNSGCASTASKLYLWYTKDVTGDPLAITALAGVTNPNTALSDANYVKMFDGSTVTANGDLNKNAGGDFMYIKMTKAKPANATFKRKFTTITNLGTQGKAYLRFYDIAKYFGIDEPNGENNVTAVMLTEIKIDGVAYSFFQNQIERSISGDKSTFSAGGVTVTTLHSSVANGGTKKTNWNVYNKSYKYRYEIEYPHDYYIKDIQLAGYIQINGERRDWDFILHKEENMYVTYTPSETAGQSYIRYSDIFRFLGYDVSEGGGVYNSCDVGARIFGVESSHETNKENVSGKPVLNTRYYYEGANLYVRSIDADPFYHTCQGYIADDVPSGQEALYGVTITYPRDKARTHTVLMRVAYSYNSTDPNFAYWEGEDEKYINIVLTPEVLIKEGAVKTGETLNLSTLGYTSAEISYQLAGDNASNASISGTNFTSNVEGIYNVDVYSGGNKINDTRIHVSKHKYPKYEFGAHYDNRYSPFTHDLYNLYLPAWDFEALVCGKNVRFCINDDNTTVTLVAGTPLSTGYKHETSLDKSQYYDVYHNNVGSFTTPERNFPWVYFNPNVSHTNGYTLDLLSITGGADVREQINFDVNYISAYCLDAEDLIVPGTVEYGGKTYTVTRIGDGALAATRSGNVHDKFVTRNTQNIILPASIKEIGDYAFYSSYAATCNFEDLVNLENMNYRSFYYSDLENVDLTRCNILTALGEESFSYCRSLETVDISNLPLLNCKNDKGAFSYCTSLTSLNMSNCNSTNVVPGNFCYNCTSLTLNNLNMDNTPVDNFNASCFENCNFSGETLDMGRIGDITSLTIDGFTNTGLKNLVIPQELTRITFGRNAFVTSTKPMIENIYILKCSDIRLSFYATYGGQAFNKADGTVNKGLRIFVRYDGLTDANNQLINKTIKNFGDEHGPRVFPMLSSNTSGFRTMSYFRPLDYKNIKVFDNTHLYGANKPGGGDYELEDFFRTDLTGIKMLTPYIATDYNVENKEVTMTALSETTPGIQTKGGIYYKGTGTSTDAADNEIFYILTEPNSNMYSGINYLKGGGKESIVLDKAPHMTETSTQFISKGGTFYYSTPGTLAPYKAYLDIPEFICTIADPGYGSQQVSALSFVWNDEEDDTATAVDAIKDNSPVTKDYFNMQGMKVKTPVSGGIYIHNGRKILVK